MSDLTFVKNLPASPLDNSQPGSHNIWIEKAERNSEVARKDGFSKSTIAWVYAKNGDIPSNAIVWGYDDGEPSYICRSLADGKMCVGKVTRNRAAAVFHYNGSRPFYIPAEDYEVLVELRMSLRWVHEETISSLESQDVYGLSKLKLVVLVDDSRSMDMENLWPEAKEALAGVADLYGKHNTDGIDLYFLNDTNQSIGLKDRKEVLRLFDAVIPTGNTPTGARLRSILDTYISQLEDRTVSHKPISIVVITDGAPDNKKELEETIVSAADRLKRSGINANSRELGIQFVQIGKDIGAEEYLKHLDNDLRSLYNIDDIVDSTTFDPKAPKFKTDRLLKIVKGAVDRSIDQGVSTHV